jgi:hypothetical protein
MIELVLFVEFAKFRNSVSVYAPANELEPTNFVFSRMYQAFTCLQDLLEFLTHDIS